MGSIGEIMPERAWHQDSRETGESYWTLNGYHECIRAIECVLEPSAVREETQFSVRQLRERQSVWSVFAGLKYNIFSTTDRKDPLFRVKD